MTQLNMKITEYTNMQRVRSMTGKKKKYQFVGQGSPGSAFVYKKQ